MSESNHGWFLTATGRRIEPMNPDPAQIDIEDIAHALSHLCRFGGHCKEFYSVAQHSVMVSFNVPCEASLAGLMHDATEAYLGDVIQPVKRSLPQYQLMEAAWWGVICQAFPKLPHCLPAEVKDADRRALMTERRDLMPAQREPWSWGVFENYAPFDEVIEPWSPRSAKAIFLKRFEDLTR